jgi:hypothetical protein
MYRGRRVNRHHRRVRWREQGRLQLSLQFSSKPRGHLVACPDWVPTESKYSRPNLPHSWHLDPCHYTSPTRPIKVATRTRQDDATTTGKDRVLLSRGSLVRVQPVDGPTWAAVSLRLRHLSARETVSLTHRGGWVDWIRTLLQGCPPPLALYVEPKQRRR